MSTKDKTVEMPSIGSLMDQFEQEYKDEKEGKVKKKTHELPLYVDDMVCGIYSAATICFLNIVGLKEDSILHMNDRHQVKDFPTALECTAELSEITGLIVTEETYIWEIAKAIAAPRTLDGVAAGLPTFNVNARNKKMRAHYH